MRAVATTVVEVAGAVSVTVGAAMVATWAGLVVGGGFAIAAGYLAGRGDA